MTALTDAINADSPDRLWTFCATRLDAGNYLYDPDVDLLPFRRVDADFNAEDDPGDLTSPCNAGDCNATHLSAGDFIRPFGGSDTTFNWGGGGTYDWTLEVWFRALAFEGDGSLQFGGDDEPAFTADWYIRVTDAGAVEVGGYSTTAGDFVLLNGNVTADGCWHQLVWQSQGSAEGDDVTLWLDGVLADTTNAGTPYDDWYSGAIPGTSFNWGTVGQFDSDVALSHLAMWQSILTPTQIEDHWDAAGPCPCGAGGWYVGSVVYGQAGGII